MSKQTITYVACLIFTALLAGKAMADGNVTTMVEPGGSTLYITADNDNNEVRISSLYGGETLLVEGLNGTTVNGDWDEYDHPGFQYENIVVDLGDGDDLLEIRNLQMGNDRIDIYQGGGDAMIFLTESVLSSSKIITGRGQDSVTVVKVEADHLRIADAEGAFPVNVAMPSTSSFISVSDTKIKCLDLQARTVEVNNHHGALIAATTFANIHDVDSETGDAQLGIWTGLQANVNPSSVVVAAEYDSPETDIEISNIRTSDFGVLYFDTLFNSRPASEDNISIHEVVTDYLTVTTGMGSDNLMISNVKAGDDAIVDLGSDSDRRNVDGSNFALLQGMSCEEDCDVLGGSGRDYLHFHSNSFLESLNIDTGEGADTIRLYFAEIKDDCEIAMGGGNDNMKSYKSNLGALLLDGGWGKDTAIHSQSSWSTTNLESIEYSNF